MSYMTSMIKTFRLLSNISLEVIYTKCDAIVQKSRNYFVALALKENATDIIFIDDDIEWEPAWISRLLDYPVDVVSGMYRKKMDDVESYPFLPIMKEDGSWYPPIVHTQTGLVKVFGVPTGFLRLSRRAMEALWNASDVYTNGALPEERAIFDVKITDGIMYSEDFVMCQKLAKLGIDVWVDPRMTCAHEGIKSYQGDFGAWLAKHHDEFWIKLWEELKDTTLSKITTHHKWVAYWKPTMTYLKSLKDGGFKPKIIYDIGACWGEWSAIAKHVWPNAQFFLFEGCDDKQSFLRRRGKFHIDVLSDKDDKEVKFYTNDIHPGGNSYYIEQTHNYCENKYIMVNTRTLDSVVKERGFPLPELVKLDVQGAEIDILRGATSTLQNVKHLLVELQSVQWNKGALLAKDGLPIIESLGFKCIAPLFANNGPDGDYGFIRE